MRSLPDGALMQRAATGLAHAVLDLLGGGYGRRVLLLVGSGDNGGDALYAGCALLRRGARVAALLLGGSHHEEGLAAFRAAGGRRRRTTSPTRRAPTSWSTASWASAAGPGCGPRRSRRWTRWPASRSWRSTCPRGSTSTPASSTGRTWSPTSPSPSAPTRWPTSSAPRPACAVRCTSSTSGSSCRPRAVESLQPDDVAALVPRPRAGRPQVLPRRGRRPGRLRHLPRRRAAVRRRRLAAAWSAWSATSGAPPTRSAPPTRRSSATGRSRPGWSARVVGTRPARSWRAALEGGVPVLVDADGLAHVRPGQAAVLTPHAGELARMLDTGRDAVEARPLAHARLAAERYDAVLLLKGRHTLVVAPDGRTRVTTTGLPWLATAGAGDVLSGVIGALLAAGLDPWDAASVGLVAPRCRSHAGLGRWAARGGRRRRRAAGGGAVARRDGWKNCPHARPRRDRRRPRGDPSQRAPAARDRRCRASR